MGWRSRIPTKTWPLWSLSLALVAGLPAISFIYFPMLLESGELPTNADSIGIPMFGSVIGAALLLPLVLAVAWFCLRRYNPRTRFSAWRRERFVRSILCTVFLGGTAAALTVLALWDVADSMPWYERLWTGYALAWVFWLLAMRAALVDQLDPHAFT